MGKRDWGIFGREAEMERFSAMLDKASCGEGRAVVIAGEPGVGKSRLVAEVTRAAKKKGFNIIEGGFSQDSARPYEAFCKALGDDLVQDEEHVTFAQILVIDQSGLLVAKAVPQGADDVDSDIFAGMLTAVQNFVKDSFGGGEGSLGRLEYGEMKIVMESMGSAILVAFFNCTEHPEMAPYVKSGARRLAQTYGALLESWGGRTDSVAVIQREIEKLAAARFLVRRDLAGIKLEKERLKVADQILTRLLRSARDQPVLFVIEDFHWADEGSLDALGYLARNATQGKLLVVATARRSEQPKMDEALKEMTSDGTAEIMDLGGISADALSGLLATEFSPNDFPQDFASRMASECKGNPFFLTEVLRQMLADGTIRIADGNYSLLSADTPLPKTVDELVQRRLDSLDPDAIALAEYAACAGKVFPISAALSMRSLKDAPLALEKLRETGIVSISESGVGEFSHAFYRDAIYGNIVPRWRSVYHKGLGEHYERAYDGRLDEAAYELARHFSMTAEKPKAVRYGIMAGEKAEASYAAEQAINFYRGAISALKAAQRSVENDERTSDLGRRVGELLVLTGEYDEALVVYRELLELGKEPEARAKIHRLIAGIKTNRGDYAEAAASIEKGMSEMAGTQIAEMGRLLNAEADLQREQGRFEKAIDISKSALALFERLGGLDGDVAYTLNTIGNGYWRKGEYASALEYYGRALAMNEKMGRERGQAVLHTNIGNVYGDQGDYPRCLEHYEKGLKFFEKIGDVRAIAIVSNNLGVFYADLGEMEKALGFYEKAVAVYKRLGDARMISSTYGNIGIVHYYQGDTAKALEHYLKGVKVAESRGGEITYIGASLTNIGVAYLESGDLALSRNFQKRAEKIALETDNKSLLVAAYTGMASIDLEEGDTASARALAEKTLEISREIGVRDSETDALRLLGILDFRAGSVATGRTNFGGALAASEGLGLGRVHAQARMDYGRSLMAAGAIDEAKMQFDKAGNMFESLSMHRKAKEARDELAKLK